MAPVVRRALGHALLPPLLVLAAAATLLFALPAGVRARISEPRAGDALLRAPISRGADAEPTDALTGEVLPPSYTGEKHITIEEPSSIEALTGGHIILRGQGAASGITATIGNAPIAPASLRDSADQWRLDIVVPAKPAALELHDRSYARTVIIAPHADSLPVVTLTAPARDTVVRTPKGALQLGATATDDYGLDAGWFEYIVSSGEGETFTFKSGVIHRTDVGGARTTTLAGSLNLDSLQLKPGDLVHVRAVARDRNNVTGPGIGVSETRTLRIPRASEYDSVAIEGAPPPDVDSSQLSQRMLIILAEKLEARRAKLPRAQVIKESQAIGSDEARLRQHVGEIVFARLGAEQGTEDAGSNNAARTDDARPAPRRRERRDAGLRRRHRLRGRRDARRRRQPSAARGVQRDVGREPRARGRRARHRAPAHAARARRDSARAQRRASVSAREGAGGDRRHQQGSPRRQARRRDVVIAPPACGARQLVRAARAALRRGAEPARDESGAAIDSLLALRVDALESAPTLAGALAPAIDALRAGHDATDALVRARRIAAGTTLTRIDSTRGAEWSEGW